MLFRVFVLLNEMQSNAAAERPVCVTLQNGIRVEIALRCENLGYPIEELWCEASADFPIKQPTQTLLTELSSTGSASEAVSIRELIIGRHSIQAFRKDHPFFPDIWLQDLPEMHHDTIKSIRERLEAGAIKVAKLLRWREGGNGSHKPWVLWQFAFSTDGTSWFKMPLDMADARLTVGRAPVRVSEVGAEIEQLVRANISEPVAHELLREAESLQRVAPRSALLVAIAAIETSLKECVISFSPSARTAISEFHSPSVSHLIKELIPRLAKTSGRDASCLRLSADEQATLDASVHQRNKIVHGLGGEPSHEKLNRLIYLARKILWSADLLCGTLWAAEHLSRLTTGAPAAGRHPPVAADDSARRSGG